jgi:hypothetical protein
MTPEYERGFVDGMQKQMQSSVDKAVNAMAQRKWVGLTDEPVGRFAKFTDGIWREVTAGSAGVPLYEMSKEDADYEYKIYDIAKFHIPEGSYSIEEVEKMLIHMKQTKQKTEAYLAKTLEPIK